MTFHGVAGQRNAEPPRRDNDTEHQKLVRVAWLYYRENLTQAQIAQQLHVSRPTVARLLERARQASIVTIDIDTTGVGGLELIDGLRQKYELRDIVIVPQVSEDSSAEVTNSRLAVEAAQYMRRFLRPGAVIGVGWGDTVLRTLLALSPSSLSGVTFATITGGIDAYTTKVSGTTNNGISDYIRFVPAPLLASSPAIASALRHERAVTNVLDMARASDAALIGIGGAIATATILHTGVVTEQQIVDYQRRGAVGDILGEWYDETGTVLAVDLQKIRIGLAIRELQTMKHVVGVAGGIDKLAAIRGALMGRYLHTLITTEDVARALAS
ncbi:sugar-binding transcriptional regulator [Microbacterium terrisoli]|uniref:sugar-binding transcriptional regulator n=1 Tax=Microbacterium terrisoli TaxID=3242192 RepID=UPI002805F690|nr:sugar-binding domain-containing protein [Microbacterium protaetiae]